MTPCLKCLTWKSTHLHAGPSLAFAGSCRGGAKIGGEGTGWPAASCQPSVQECRPGRSSCSCRGATRAGRGPSLQQAVPAGAETQWPVALEAGTALTAAKQKQKGSLLDRCGPGCLAAGSQR